MIKCDLGIFPDISASRVFQNFRSDSEVHGGNSPGNMLRIITI